MPSMTGFEFGDIVLVPFPFTDQSVTKKRPAVVISSAAYQRERPDIIIIAIGGATLKSLLDGEFAPCSAAQLNRATGWFRVPPLERRR